MGRGETNAKKRKRNSEAKELANGAPKAQVNGEATAVDTSRPTAVFKPTRGRDWTVSVALPGSIIANAQSHDLRTSLSGQIARALSVFCVDEVIVFSDALASLPNKTPKSQPKPQDAYTGTTDPSHFLVHLLSYLETPPHLRRLLFPLHPNLRTAGTLPSLDLPHHLKAEEWCEYREGVSHSQPTNHKHKSPEPGTTQIEAGLRIPMTLSHPIPPSTRVTLRFPASAQSAALPDSNATEINAKAVNPDEPREEGGYYWGYQVRRAESLSAVFEECTFEGGYDISIGTSERGVPLESLYQGTAPNGSNVVNGGRDNMSSPPNGGESAATPITPFKHLLIVFGGVAGLEVALKNDSALQKLGVKEAKDVFDYWVNVCPGQGSRTIRTEEAVWIGLMGLRRLVERNYQSSR